MKQYIAEVMLDSEPLSEAYLKNIPAIKHLLKGNTIKFNSPVTFFVGDNGTGKSTLLEAIAVAYGFNAEGGSRNFSFSTNATHSDLFEHITLAKRNFAKDGYFLRAESLYNVATNIEELDKQPAAAPSIIESYGGVSLHNQSHGESFMTLVQKRFGGNGLYILDEPEAALSPSKLLTLLAEINRLVNQDSQFIIVTHSPILMAYPDAEILLFSKNGINNCKYEETEHFKITKSFLENPDRMMKYLFEN